MTDADNTARRQNTAGGFDFQAALQAGNDLLRASSAGISNFDSKHQQPQQYQQQQQQQQQQPPQPQQQIQQSLHAPSQLLNSLESLARVGNAPLSMGNPNGMQQPFVNTVVVPQQAQPQQQQQVDAATWHAMQQALTASGVLGLQQQHQQPMNIAAGPALGFSMQGLGQAPESMSTNVTGAPAVALQTSTLMPAVDRNVSQVAPMEPKVGINGMGNDMDSSETNGRSKRRRDGYGKFKTEPSVVSSGSISMFDQGPPKEKDEAEIQKMTPAERRRYERNLREQQRSYRISQQIKELRDVLTESNIPFKPNKFSILVSIAEYIKQLQSRAIMLDSEHQKLLDTINSATEIAASGQTFDDYGKDTSSASGAENDQDLMMVTGIDYKGVFEQNPVGFGVATLDGRLLDCNNAFEELFDCKPEQMNSQCLFNFIRNHDDVFEAMADLLRRAAQASEAGEGTVKEQHLLFWCGSVATLNGRNLRFTITLTSTADSNPKFFSFSASSIA